MCILRHWLCVRCMRECECECELRIFEPIDSVVCKYTYIRSHFFFFFGWHCLCGLNSHWRWEYVSVSVAVPVIFLSVFLFQFCVFAVVFVLRFRLFCHYYCRSPLTLLLHTIYLLLYCVLDDSRHYIGEVFSVLCYRLGNLLQLLLFLIMTKII